MRQWVLAFPHRVRFALARTPRLLSATLTLFIRARARARGLTVTRAGSSGAVTFVQRFGSALQLTPHFHTLVPDGIFVEETSGSEDRLRFVPLEPPEDGEVEGVLRRVVAGVDKLLSARGLSGRPGEPSADEPTDLLSSVLASAGDLPRRRPQGGVAYAQPALCARTARQDGFSLHAGVAVHENDRQGLERLQLILDERRSNASQIVAAYLGEIIDRFVAVVTRNWFNPSLEFTWFTVPGLIAIIALIVGLVVTGLSVARERELGTFDRFLAPGMRGRTRLPDARALSTQP